MRKSLAYMAIVALVALGLTALVLAANPIVADQYRAYFIDRSTDCWPAGVNGTLPVTGRIRFLNADSKDTARRVLECGWTDPEPTGAWSSGGDVRIAIRPTGTGPWTVELDLLPFSGEGIPPQDVTVVANGETLLETELRRGGEIQHRLQLQPRHLEEDGRAVLRFSLPDAISPAAIGLSPDTRKLALRLLSLKVSPRETN